MSKNKKQSLEEALSIIEDKPQIHKTTNIQHNIVKETINNEEKNVNKNIKKLIVEISEEAHLQLHQLRLDLREKSIKNLVYEALNDLFKKYNKPPIV